MKILFQGDSITDAFRKPTELNPAFQLGNGYVFLVGAHLGAHFPERRFDLINRAVSGEGVQELAVRWQDDAIDLQPDVLSLLTGVNMIIRRRSGKSDLSNQEFFCIYRNLLDQMRRQMPRSKFILMEPYLLEAGVVTSDWKDEIRPVQAGIAELAREYGTVFVPLQQVFDKALAVAPAEYWAYDGIHATHAGFDLIARAWLDAAAPVLGITKQNDCPAPDFLSAPRY